MVHCHSYHFIGLGRTKRRGKVLSPSYGEEGPPWHAEEPNVTKQLVWRSFTGSPNVYMLFLIQ